MPRAKTVVPGRARRRKVLKKAKGNFSGRRKLFKSALLTVQRAGQFAYEHRRTKKRDFRRLWITRINAAARINGLSYSTLIAGLKRANVEVNRKLLADLAVRDAAAFAKLAEVAKSVEATTTAVA
jgi:large subunit ribosomal protein L20